MPASYVKAYVKRGKNDAADAAAICEAVTRPTMRFVPIKTADQQALLMLHRTRDLLVRQRTQLINAIRAHLAELGLVAAQGRDGLKILIGIVMDEASWVPGLARRSLQALLAQLGTGPADWRDRASHPCGASNERSEPAARDNTWHRRRRGDGDRRYPSTNRGKDVQESLQLRRLRPRQKRP
jgi:hypothetical protein